MYCDFGVLYEMWILPLLYVFGQIVYSYNKDWCKPNSWKCGNYGHCSQSCGGGTQSKRCVSCVQSLVKHESRNCNEHCLNGGHYDNRFFARIRCNCHPWNNGRCCENCNMNYRIDHCYPRKIQCNTNSVRCTECEDPYYPGGYGLGCLVCPSIQHCTDRHCTTASNTICKTCEHNRVFFKVSPDKRQCERMCARNNHYCWPGTCDNGLTKNCKCEDGFKLTTTSSETSCQLESSPSIQTCQVSMIGPNGEMKMALSNNSASTACHFMQDFYGNFQVTKVTFDMLADFTINISKSILKPTYLMESNFGVTDTTIYVLRKTVQGIKAQLEPFKQLIDINNGIGANSVSAPSGNISTPNHNLSNGESLCLVYEALGGGYLKSINTIPSIHIVSGPVPYQKTKTTRELCYIYDDVEPKHCSQSSTCSAEPIQIDRRVTWSPHVKVDFIGWFDPVPVKGTINLASGIESYQITVNQVLPSKHRLKVDTKLVFTKKVNSSVTSINLNLKSDKPVLYSILLEVKDVADNVKQARRFVLYDNTSSITTLPKKSFIVKSASVDTNHTWQTHHGDICLNWYDFFLNEFYYTNPLLNPIEPDSYGLIAGVYEQNNGVLPVSGTPNVHGIIKYMFSWKLNNGIFKREISVPEFLNQTYCQNFGVKDGQTYTFSIRPVDVANHSYIEKRTLYIDRSVPHVNNIWLTKDGHRSLFVHDSTDLSKMELYFETLDSHSGILHIDWTFGLSDSGTELGNGSLKVGRIEGDNCTNIDSCYCPDIGVCEVFNYSIPLNKLVDSNTNVGNHNRNYYFTVKVTNHAMLSNIEHVDILVDDSPPEVGTLFEGSPDSPDIDYTSADSIIVNWHGFIDHESGIKEYRIGLAARCLGQQELYHYENTSSRDITFFHKSMFSESVVRVPVNFTGKMFFSIIALNNAMNPSKAVCSDGITRDLSPPEIINVTIQHAKWSESIMCQNGSPWLLHSSISKIKLKDTNNCIELCSNITEVHDIHKALPVSELEQKDDDVSSFMCGALPLYNKDIIIYIPNDHINIKWEIDEEGSQIDEFMIGFGIDASEKIAPSLIAYRSTGQKSNFRQNHEGIGSNSLFYIFIKVTNKAGLEHITTLGPILIDETPPLYNDIPEVKIEENEVIIGWDYDSFYDMEQTSQINQLFFQVGHDGISVTPLLEWRLDSSIQCVNYTGGCIIYPLRKLQRQDTDYGLDFYVNLIIFNNAGHSLKLTTPIFKLPSRYPPGTAIVKDIDPSANTEQDYTNDDINVHFTEQTLCAEWDGFKHHESIKLELGVGIVKDKDNIVQFHEINASNSKCLSSPNIISGVQYFVLVRAVCSGGQTVSASNGVTIWSEANLKQSLTVRLGDNCLSNEPFLNDIANVSSSNNTYEFLNPLQIGVKYTLYAHYQPSANQDITSLSAKVSIMYGLHNGTYFEMTPFSERPSVSFNISTRNSILIHIQLFKCQNTLYVNTLKKIPTFWFYNTTTIPLLSYEVSIFTSNTSFSNSTTLQPTYIKSDSQFCHVFKDVLLKPKTQYLIGVRACSLYRCMNPILSTPFEADIDPPFGNISLAEIEIDNNKNCVDFTMNWTQFVSTSGVEFYQWTISKDKDAHVLIKHWTTIPDGTQSFYKVTHCLTLPKLPHSKGFGCVRAFSKVATYSTICTMIQTKADGAFKGSVVYDFDTTQPTWNTILKFLSSSNIGEQYSILHEAELNFARESVVIGGAVLYTSERKVTWYLMTSPNKPTTCTSVNHCVQSTVTTNGYVIFPKVQLLEDTFYYICASANQTVLKREYFSETLDAFETCSNGFVLDSEAPFVGFNNVVNVSNSSNYITDLQEITVTWARFSDNIDATILGYPDRISYYSIEFGSQEGGNDLNFLTNVGLNTVYAESELNVTDGTTVYVTVTATDHANLSTSLSSEGLLVDTTPPLVGMIFIENSKGKFMFINDDFIALRLVDFSDPHSGIAYFAVGIGSHAYIDDILPFRNIFDNYVNIPIVQLHLHEGHAYYIIVKAVNRAGLVCPSISNQFVIDMTPPTGGQVMDGSWELENDLDYQTDISSIYGHWKQFIDGESGINYFRVGLGSQPYIYDIEPVVSVGLKNDIVWKGSFMLGKRHYITVEACNGAELCRSVSSDGIVLDNSPPIHGIVRVGNEGQHQKYQPHNTSVHIQWNGFEDPQSSIEHFEVCLGTSSNTCDIKDYFPCLLVSNIILTGLGLPLNTDIYASVKAINRVGMSVSQSSDAFRVDQTAPFVVTLPTYVLDFNTVLGKSSQWEKSILRVFWKFEDDESPILQNFVSLTTHQEGHTPIENIVLGSVDNLTINLDGKHWLHNGYKYIITVTSCNAAGLCTSEQSRDLLIDSSPPESGAFKPPMSWKNYKNASRNVKSILNLTWYGFNEPESAIEHYYFTVSRSYSGNELSNGIIRYTVNNTNNEYMAQFDLHEGLFSDDQIVLAIWAQNRIGLNSTISRITVNALSKSSNRINNSIESGVFEIEKHSCDVHFCNKDCTCAVVGKPCTDVYVNNTCSVLNDDDIMEKQYPVVDVYTGLRGQPLNITSSSACLSAHWNVKDRNNSLIKRFEWSIGINNQNIGEGIFDLKHEIPWNDVGLQTEVVYCLSMNRSLLHRKQYVIYVKTWYEKDIFALFKSSPILVDQTAPAITRGRFVKDSDFLCEEEFDYINWMHTITACWDKVFSEQQGAITYYTIALGTSEKADDVFPTTNVDLRTNLSLHNTSLSHGTHYYFTITAYNNVGLHVSATSDGFVIDMDIPVAGVVFNTARHTDKLYQSSQSSFSLSWHGFVDHFSGIMSYHVAMSDNKSIETSNLNFTDVDIKTTYTFKNMSLEHGQTYYGFVKASDAAGHMSPVSISRGRMVDISPPTGVNCQTYRLLSITTIDQNDTVSASIHNFTKGSVYNFNGTIITSYHAIKATLNIGRLHLNVPLTLNHNGDFELQYRFISPLSGEHTFSLNIFPGKEILTFQLYECANMKPISNTMASMKQIGRQHLAINFLVMDAESEIYRINIGAGTTHGGFQVRPLTRVNDKYNELVRVDVPHGSPVFMTAIVDNHAGLRSVFYSKPITIDHTPPSIHNQVSNVTVIQSNDNDGNDSRQEVVIETTWHVFDNESGIKYCFCAIGSKPGAEDIAPRQLSSKPESCSSYPLFLLHGTLVHVTIRCVNNVELSVLAISNVTVAVEPPDTRYASLSFVTLNRESTYYLSSNYSSNKQMTNETTYIQSNTSCVQISWTGFSDMSGITQYEYRLLNGVNDRWIKTDTREFVYIQGLNLRSSEKHTAQVRAKNVGNYVSRIVQAKLMVLPNKPMLTGQSMFVVESEKHLKFDWSNVFDTTHVNVTYDVIIGSRGGYNDILDLHQACIETFELTVPKSTIITPKILELFISITCTYPTGLSNNYMTSYNLLNV